MPGIGERLARHFLDAMVDATAPGWVTVAAVEVARAIRKRVRERSKREDLARTFVQVFAEETGIKVTFPVDVRAKVVRDGGR